MTRAATKSTRATAKAARAAARSTRATASSTRAVARATREAVRATRREAKSPPSPRGERRASTLSVLCASQSAHALALARLAEDFARTLTLGDAELSLSLVGDAEIRKLKRQYFGVDAATDVLSFPAGDFPGPGPRPLGDVVISLDTARRNARTFGNTLGRELALYLAHGLLHLLGFDHRSVREARAMEAQERRLLGHAGMLARSDEV